MILKNAIIANVDTNLVSLGNQVGEFIAVTCNLLTKNLQPKTNNQTNIHHSIHKYIHECLAFGRKML